MATKVLKRVRLADRAYGEIVDLLRNGQISDGDDISFGVISKKLGIGRTPVTLALDRLQREGLVESIPRVGTRVCRVDATSIWGMIRWRVAMECEVAREVCRWMTPEERRTLIESGEKTDRDAERASPQLKAFWEWADQKKSEQKQIDPSFDVTALVPTEQNVSIDREFHIKLAALCRAPKLEHEVRTTLDILSIKLQVCEAVSAAVSRSFPPEPPPNHAELARTIAESSPEEAEACMRKHIENGVFIWGFLVWYRSEFMKDGNSISSLRAPPDYG